MMKSVDSRVEVALPSDQNYVHGLLVTAASMAAYANQNIVLSFNILDGGIANDTFREFSKRIQQIHPKTEFRRFRVNELEFAEFALGDIIVVQGCAAGSMCSWIITSVFTEPEEY